MRLGILGGTFNPPHLGHVICAQEARMQLDLDEVLIVPAGVPPHREIDPASDPGNQLRVAMCRLAVIGQPGLKVSTEEIDRPGPSYSVDTLERLAAVNPDTELTLVIGADQAMAFGNWRDPERIGELARVAVAARVDHDCEQAVAEVTRATGVEPLVFDMPRVDISSSMIRDEVQRGETVSHLVPAGVAELIEEEGCYR
jgi:nicotinate-nucleotide adenylyltransferase